jgi:hypothetical protein
MVAVFEYEVDEEGHTTANFGNGSKNHLIPIFVHSVGDPNTGTDTLK